MNEFAYIMALENFPPNVDLNEDNQKKTIFSGSEKVFVDIRTKEGGSGNRDEIFTKMLDEVNSGDIIKIAKLSVLGPTITDILRKYSLIILKNAKLYVFNMGMITDELLSSNVWMNAIVSIEEDRLYYNRCFGLLKMSKNSSGNSENNSPGATKKYSNKQLKDALKLKEIYTYSEISKMTGISQRTLYRASKQFEEQ